MPFKGRNVFYSKKYFTIFFLLTIFLNVFIFHKSCSQSFEIFEQQDLIPFKKYGKWGLKNNLGKVILKPTFDSIASFYEGRGTAYLENKRYLIDKSGTILRPLKEPIIYGKVEKLQKDSGFLQMYPRKMSNLSGNTILNLTQICPPNIDFELGDFTNWTSFIGGVSGVNGNNIITVTSSPPTNGRHEVFPMQTNKVDPYGGFPLRAPNSSEFAVKLGNDFVGRQAERIRYVINVPSNNPDYSITFQYAVVLENPDLQSTGVPHEDHQQPRLTAKFYNPRTNEYIPCGSFTYVASQVNTIPGFYESPILGGPHSNPPGARIWYKPWSTVYVNLSDYQGETLFLEFTTADCTLGGHFGYAYVDVTECGIGIQSEYNCTTNRALLTAPEGFEKYTWYDSSFSQVLGNGRSLAINSPNSVGRRYFAIVKPYNNTDCGTCDCSDTLQTRVSINYPMADAGPDKSMCQNGNVILGSSGLQNLKYLWSPAIVLSDALVPRPEAKPDQTTLYHLLVTDIRNGCTSNDSVLVEVFKRTTPSFLISDDRQCLKQNFFTFSNKTEENGQTVQYVWNFGDGQSSNENSPQIRYLQHGSFQISLLAKTDKGCIDSSSQTIHVISSPDPTFLVDRSAQCLKGNIFGFAAKATSGVRYEWDFGDGTGTFSAASTYTHSYLFPGTFQVRIIAINDDGCRDSADQTITVFPEPIANFNLQDTGVCFRNNNLSASNSSTISAGNLTYRWDFGDGSPFQSVENAVHYYDRPGQFNVVLHVISQNGCRDSVQKSFQVYPQSKPDFTINDPSQCFENNKITLTNNSVAPSGTKYYWTYGDGRFSQQVRPEFSYMLPGSYKVLLETVTVQGCRDTSSANIEIFAHPKLSLSNIRPLTFCADDSTILMLQTMPGSGRIVDLSWFREGTVIPGMKDSTIVIKQSGNHKAVVTNSFGCVSKDSLPIIVHPLPNSILSPLSKNYICPGESVRLQASGGESYNWYLNGTQISGFNESFLLVTQAGRFTVVAISKEGCKKIADNIIETIVYSAPKADFDFKEYCVSIPIKFENLSQVNQSGPVRFTWKFPTTTIADVNQPVYSFGSPGTYQVLLTVQSEHCLNIKDSLLKNITIVEPGPNLRYPTIDAIINRPFSLQAREGAVDYLWTPALGLNQNRIRNPIFNFNRQMDYLIRVTNPSGCNNIDSQLVRVFGEADIFVPNAFTPNNDGNNDLMFPIPVGMIKLKFFRIFNRWGQLMFESRDTRHIGWNGIWGGKPQPMDTYTWTAEAEDIDGRIIRRNGNFVLIR
jgi:gliding motility-associated-like protein